MIGSEREKGIEDHMCKEKWKPCKDDKSSRIHQNWLYDHKSIRYQSLSDQSTTKERWKLNMSLTLQKKNEIV